MLAAQPDLLQVRVELDPRFWVLIDQRPDAPCLSARQELAESIPRSPELAVNRPSPLGRDA